MPFDDLFDSTNEKESQGWRLSPPLTLLGLRAKKLKTQKSYKKYKTP